MVTNHQNAERVSHNAIKEMVRKPLEIHASKIAFANGVRVWRVGRFFERTREVLHRTRPRVQSRGIFVVIHDPRYVGKNKPVKFDAHLTAPALNLGVQFR